MMFWPIKFIKKYTRLVDIKISDGRVQANKEEKRTIFGYNANFAEDIYFFRGGKMNNVISGYIIPSVSAVLIAWVTICLQDYIRGKNEKRENRKKSLREKIEAYVELNNKLMLSSKIQDEVFDRPMADVSQEMILKGEKKLSNIKNEVLIESYGMIKYLSIDKHDEIYNMILERQDSHGFDGTYDSLLTYVLDEIDTLKKEIKKLEQIS